MSLKSKIVKFCTLGRWTLGFIEEPIGDIVAGKPIKIHYLQHHYKNRWFADPFILDVDDTRIYVLVEEYYDPIQRGRISLLTIDRASYKLLEVAPILELSTHLSFPAIRREEGKTFIYPENAAGEGLGLYEFDRNTCTCKHIKTISKEPLADAIITEIFGEELMFSTHVPTHNGNVLDVHRLEEGVPVKYSECVFSSNTARNAGDWFKVGQKVYRPAQDCNATYGGATILQEVKREGEQFAFTDVRRLTTTHPSYTTGLHTFNHYKGLTVIDVHGWRHAWAEKVLGLVIKIVRL